MTVCEVPSEWPKVQSLGKIQEQFDLDFLIKHLCQAFKVHNKSSVTRTSIAHLP